MRFASLGSGSRGNATIVVCGKTCLMLDCGFTLKETQARLASLGLEASELSGIVMTHEHGDHVRGVGPLARKFGLPVWMTSGTWLAVQRQNGVGPLPELHLFSAHARFEIDDILVEPFPVPHDAQEPSQFVFSNGDQRLGVLTDTGSATPHIEANLSHCDALMLECNHDRKMLFGGDYPQSLKERIASRMGHLDNEASGAILSRLDTSRLQHMVIAHISEKNNTPALARAALGRVLGCGGSDIDIAGQDDGLPWRELTA